jgi:Flp pilus assembly protein TadD
MHRHVGKIGYGLAAAAFVAVLLAGCSAANIGGSTYGNSKQSVAELSNIGDYTAERALSEARTHFRNNDFGYSAALYKRAAELTPKDTEAYIGLGASYDRLGRFDLSDRVYEAWLKLSGASVQYYNNLGYSMMLRGNLSGALANFRKAQKLDPDNLVVANNLQLLTDIASKARKA